MCTYDLCFEQITTNIKENNVKITIFTAVRYHILAHLSRRLIGELIVYTGIRRPSVVRRPSTFSNDIPSKAVRPILSIFHI